MELLTDLRANDTEHDTFAIWLNCSLDMVHLALSTVLHRKDGNRIDKYWHLVVHQRPSQVAS